MKFMDAEHKAFFEQQVAKTRTERDPYRKAMFYAFGLTDTTRRHINELYDYAEDCPRFAGAMRKAWQTSGSVHVTRLAFNLFNGYVSAGKADKPKFYSPYEIFDDELMEWMFEAIRIRYPEHSAAGQERTKNFIDGLLKGDRNGI